MATLPPGGALITHQVALPRGQRGLYLSCGQIWLKLWWMVRVGHGYLATRWRPDQPPGGAYGGQRCSLIILSISTQHSIPIKSTFPPHIINMLTTSRPQDTLLHKLSTSKQFVGNIICGEISPHIFPLVAHIFSVSFSSKRLEKC